MSCPPWLPGQTRINGTELHISAQEFAKIAAEARLEGQITKRNAVRDWSHLWPLGVVYYDIDARTADFQLLQMLAPAFEFFKKYTCIRWRRRLPTNYAVQDYVIFSMPRAGTRLCNSEVGRQTGRQYIYLDAECVKSLAEVLHQMTHALGFYHMNNRLDRDKYITVFPQNAAPQNRKFFDKSPANVADSLGFPYEHKSLMHFDGFKFATGSKPTIVSKVPGVLLGNKIALTVQDVTMINTLYAQCKNVDECLEQNGGCDHVCTKHGAWFECSCKDGYSLASDGYSCEGQCLITF
ncbi:zinc metalloproteinase nas-14-like [Watersipora subatra]|uniref:zinc metalloproteinase nas-14-like n=1 Tax=Watersipora subatra TaxID=2589382 RepID=UPI00355C1582